MGIHFGLNKFILHGIDSDPSGRRIGEEKLNHKAESSGNREEGRRDCNKEEKRWAKGVS